MNRSLDWLKARPEVAIAVVMVLGTLLLPKHAPVGVYGFGLISGALLVLPAIAIVLVHRANGIINFAQIMIGTACTTLFTVLTTSRVLTITSTSHQVLFSRRIGYFPLAAVVSKVCDACVTKVGADPAYITLKHGTFVANYIVAALLTLLAATVLMMLTYLAIQRFNRAPRLIVTIATLFVGQVISAVAQHLPTWLVPGSQQGTKGIGFPPVPPPVNASFSIGPIVFDEASITTFLVAAVLLVALAVYLARSNSGTAIRAAAENPARVATLGVDARAVVGKVWLISGLFAGATGVLLAMIQGVGDIHASDAVFSVPTSVRILAVVVLARFVSVRMAIVGAAAIGMAQEATRWSYHSTVVLDGSLLAVIALALLLQRRRMSRAELAQTIGWQADREIRPIPRELRGLPSVRNWVRTVIIGSLVVALGVPWILNASQLDQMTLALLYAMICLSLLVLTGWSGQISLGQVALAGVGAWAAAWSGLPFPLALLIGAVGGAIAATLVGIPALRLRGLNLAIITLAFAVTVSSFVLDRGYLGGHLPARLNRPSVLGLNLDDQRTHYYVILVILALVTMAVLGMRRSRTARAFIALRDNEQAAQSFAIAATRARLSSFAISGAIAGLAGTLIAYTDGAVDPSRFTPDFGVTLFLGAVIGGFGSVLGPILGGLYVGVLPLLGNVGQDIGQFGGIGGLALILTVGGGLSQLFYRMRDGMLRRVANRHGVVVPSLVADLLTDGRRRLVPIAAKRRDGGGTAFVPQRYRLSDQWAFGESGPVRQLDDALVATSPAWVEAVPDGSH